MICCKPQAKKSLAVGATISFYDNHFIVFSFWVGFQDGFFGHTTLKDKEGKAIWNQRRCFKKKACH